MRYTLKPAALLLACSLGAAPVFAQSGKARTEKNITKEETVIIKNDKGDGKTVIEIKDGNISVNGEVVMDLSDVRASSPVHKKIIVEGPNSNGLPDLRFFNFGDGDDDKGPRKAMLGVLTDPGSDKKGAVIKDVTPGSAADEAGLQSGDIITKIDDKKIKDAGALVAEIASGHEAGDKVSIEYERDGKKRSTTATLMPAAPQTAMRSFRFGPEGFGGGEMPNSLFRNFPFMASDDMSPAPKLGVSAEDRADGDGVRVLSVQPGSAAASAGLKEGDVIIRIDEEKVTSVDELQMSLRGMKGGEKVKLEYQRAGKLATTDVLLPKTVRKKDL